MGDHYEWSNEVSQSLYMGEPGRRIFDRFNGNQVLYIINFFGQSIGQLTVPDGRQIEQLILSQLPLNTKSEMSVFNWLRGIYLYYGN